MQKLLKVERSSIFTAEFVAILLALQFLINLPVTLFKVAIFVDSNSVLCALDSFNTDTRPDLVTEINHLTHCLWLKGTDTSFCWVPSHVGLCGNEMVDKAVKRGAQNSEKSAEIRHYPAVKEVFISLKLTSWDWFLKQSSIKSSLQKKLLFPFIS